MPSTDDEPNPFTRPPRKHKKDERPTIDELVKSAGQATKLLGDTASAAAGHFVKIAAMLPETQEVHALREQAKKKIHGIADSL